MTERNGEPMASVFKLGRDKKKRNASWYFEFKDEHGKKRMRKGFTDKGLTEKLASKTEMECQLRASGLIDDQLEKQAAQKTSAIEPHVKDYEKALLGKGNAEKYIRLTISRIRKVVNGCEFEVLGDLNADDVEAFLVPVSHIWAVIQRGSRGRSGG